MAKKSRKKIVDVGFGKGEWLRRFKDQAHLDIEGVEQPTAKKLRVPFARLDYRGFDHWLKTLKPASYSVVNFGFFLIIIAEE